jgi:exodeoxyribonuclease VII large subunit
MGIPSRLFHLFMSLEDLPLFASIPEKSKNASKEVAEAVTAAKAAVEKAEKLAAQKALEPAPKAQDPKKYTVTELTSHIRGILEPSLTQIWVVAEVSNYRPAASGHAYFSLKDSGSCISAAYFGWGAKRRQFELKDGLQVLVRGKVTVYPPRGTYQITCDQIEPLGAGALQVAFEQLKAQLAAEGLFETARKRALPRFPSRIAVVTSPSGAAIQDMLNILGRRAPHLRVTIIPAIVQGSEAASQIIRGLEYANQRGLGEIVVLARGGGSIEDLWSFNDESLARAIVKSKLPVISAVGHEIDFTISDFVSDLRAPTPSAAAEIVTGHWVDAVSRVKDSGIRLRNGILRDLQQRKTVLSHIAARVVSPRDRLREQAQRCDELFLRLERAFRLKLERRQGVVEQLMGKLDALSPLRVLERGYTLVRGEEGAVIRSSRQVIEGQILEITFHDGQRTVQAR